jgi:hypothetical protein
MDDLKFFVPFTKRNDDLQLTEGYASSEAVDSQGEVVELNAISQALPGYMKFGNIREMHQWSAVGKAIQAKIDGKGLLIKAHIVDPVAWQKVKEKVYNGYSIGGKVLKKVGDRIQELVLNEISLVDRPANPEAIFTMVKMEDGKVTEMQDENSVAKQILELAKVARVLLNKSEAEGRSTFELQESLNKIKDMAVFLGADDKAKFEKVLYEVDFGELDNLSKKELNSEDRKHISSENFAYVDSKGEKHLPIQDKVHVQNAMARFNQTDFESPDKKKAAARKILAAAKKFGIEVGENSSVKIEKADDLKEYIDTSWEANYFSELKKVLG